MTTRTPSCDWVRARLPLEIGPVDGDFGDGRRLSAGPRAVDRVSGFESRSSQGEDAGLDARERSKLGRHLDGCAACRHYRAELIDAMTVLSTVSAIAPVEPHSPSLWPGLELRIREQEQIREQRAKAPSRLVSLRTFAFGHHREPLVTELRNRLAQGRDAVLELIDRSGDFLPERRIQLRPGIVLGCLAAALACGVIALQADRTLSQSRLEIAQGARPILPTVLSTPAVSTDHELEAEIDVAAEDGGNRWLWHSSPRTFEDDKAEESRSDLPGALAQAELHPHSRQTSASTAGATTSNAGSGFGSASGTSGSPAPASKYDYFDLERGTPMAPDSRDAKPAY